MAADSGGRFRSSANNKHIIGGSTMRTLAFVLGLLVAGGLLSSTAVYAADEEAMKKCEAMTDAAEKEKCMKEAGGG
jgi:hypothetical protein